jgi:hypothetical protein
MIFGPYVGDFRVAGFSPITIVLDQPIHEYNGRSYYRQCLQNTMVEVTTANVYIDVNDCCKQCFNFNFILLIKMPKINMPNILRVI